MANICEGCTTRYATGLDVCPQCGSRKRHDEHEVPEVAEVAEVTPAAKLIKPGKNEPGTVTPDEPGGSADGDGAKGM